MKKIDNFIEFLISCINDHYDKKQGLFINRFGGTDFKELCDYKFSKIYDINKSIAMVEEWNGYYDLTTCKDERHKNYIKYLMEIDRIYKNNEVSSSIGVSYLTLTKMLITDPVLNYYFIEMEKNHQSYQYQFFSYNLAFENIENFLTIFAGIAQNKKILIVNSFTESIKYQLDKGNFLNSIELPKCEYLFLKTYMTYRDEKNGLLETPHQNFLETVDYYNQEIDKMDFDIALLGCGSYAHFLGEYIKSKNKIAIYVGGMLQMYFGVLGDRWINRAKITDQNLIKSFSKYGDRFVSHDLVNDLNLENCIKPIEHFDYTKNRRKESLNHYLLSYDSKVFTVPTDFNWKEYIKQDAKMEKFSEIDAKNHYILSHIANI